jgi:hypothetical protein
LIVILCADIAVANGHGRHPRSDGGLDIPCMVADVPALTRLNA